MGIKMTLTVSSMLPTAAWPQSVSLPATAALSASLVAEQMRSELVCALPMAAAFVPAPQDHQVPAQAETGKTALVRVNGNKGTTGFKGSNLTISSKRRYAEGGSGAPPRGRPV